jgi:hypothetical protein
MISLGVYATGALVITVLFKVAVSVRRENLDLKAE